MSEEPSQFDPPVVVAAQPLAGAGAGHGDSAVALPRFQPSLWRPRLAWPRVATGPLAARTALATIILCAAAVVLFATAQQSTLVPRSYLSFPHWESGPVHHLLGALTNDYTTLSIGFSVVLVLALVAYGVALASYRTLSMRTIFICIGALHAILLLSPPLQLTDLFNYLGYARLGAVHHLNPYLHTMVGEAHDPVFRFTSWHRLRSPYGPLFTVLTIPFAFTSVAVAYWGLKVITLLMSLGFVALVWVCARQLGRDPRFAVVFVALNPVFLFYGVAGFHNDFFMLVAWMAAIAFVLSRRDGAAGAAVMVAAAVKFTGILILPFLFIGTRSWARRKRMLVGAAIGAIPLIAMSIALFGLATPNLQDQSTLLTVFSIPNLAGWLIGAGGGAPWLLRVADVALVIVVLYELRRREWLIGAGWSTLALVASLAWLVPWYIIWATPLAALGTSARLRRATLIFTTYLVIAFAPVTGILLSKWNIDLTGSAVGRATMALQNKLSQ